MARAGSAALLGALAAMGPAFGRGAEVTGRLEMPASCSPTVSPAVVRLEPLDGPPPEATIPAEPPSIQQTARVFRPRVVVTTRGRPVRFGNGDPEQHNVHIQGPGANFNQTIPPGGSAEFVPTAAGPLTVLCDVHSHMRAYVIVGESPWIAACGPDGSFRFRNVPPGRYRLLGWHEMGDPLSRQVTIDGDRTDLGTLSLPARPATPAAGAAAKAEPWHAVVDRVGLLLASALDAARQPGGRARAVTFAQDAYFGEFEASDMETAVRAYLGLARAHEIESHFRDLTRTMGAVAEGRTTPGRAVEQTRALLVELGRTCDELNSKGIADRSKVLASTQPGPTGAAGGTDAGAALEALGAAFAKVQDLADRGDAVAAAVALGEDGYFGAFEPLERALQPREPATVTRLEARFNALRGEIGRGRKGTELASDLSGLRGEVAAAAARLSAARGGGFGQGFGASLLTIVREGVEVILMLTMLGALVVKSGRRDLLPALRWGVSLAVVASGLTAWGLNLLVRSAAGRTQELIEGLVLLAASGVLFYVSYWLISQSESRRWMAFLKRKASEGASLGGAFTLGLTAFLAVYREGAETALMYQSLLSLNGRDRAGLAGIVAGLLTGLAILAVLYAIIRASSVRLPLRAFFRVTGVLLFALSVVFAGHAVFELQSAGVIRTTGLPALGAGLPLLGLYPSLQSVGVQAILLLGAAGAAVALAVGPKGSAEQAPRTPAGALS